LIVLLFWIFLKTTLIIIIWLCIIITLILKSLVICIKILKWLLLIILIIRSRRLLIIILAKILIWSRLLLLKLIIKIVLIRCWNLILWLLYETYRILEGLNWKLILCLVLVWNKWRLILRFEIKIFWLNIEIYLLLFLNYILLCGFLGEIWSPSGCFYIKTIFLKWLILCFLEIKMVFELKEKKSLFLQKFENSSS
jgi:hypothetical protein